MRRALHGRTVFRLTCVRIRHEPGRSAYGRKGQSGCCVVKTSKAVLIGVFNEKMVAGQCNTVCEKLADYLRDSGY